MRRLSPAAVLLGMRWSPGRESVPAAGAAGCRWAHTRRVRSHMHAVYVQVCACTGVCVCVCKCTDSCDLELPGNPSTPGQFGRTPLGWQWGCG